MGLIDPDGASFQFHTVRFFYCGFGFALRWHFHESESSWFAAKPVFYEIDRVDLAELFKGLT
jgi:hypothetical protein